MAEPMSTEADIVERLRHAHEHSQQRIAGSDIFKAAADEITALRDALRPFVTACTLGTEGPKVINKTYHGLNPISVVVTKFQYLAARKVMGSAVIATSGKDAT